MAVAAMPEQREKLCLVHNRMFTEEPLSHTFNNTKHNMSVPAPAQKALINGLQGETSRKKQN